MQSPTVIVAALHLTCSTNTLIHHFQTFCTAWSYIEGGKLSISVAAATCYTSLAKPVKSSHYMCPPSAFSLLGYIVQLLALRSCLMTQNTIVVLLEPSAHLCQALYGGCKCRHSTVWSCLSKHSNTTVVVKAYEKQCMCKRHFQNMRREISIMTKLTHLRYQADSVSVLSLPALELEPPPTVMGRCTPLLAWLSRRRLCWSVWRGYWLRPSSVLFCNQYTRVIVAGWMEW